MKKTYHHVIKKILLLATIVMNLFSCQRKIPESASISATSEAGSRNVNLICFAPQGNGGNWAATLGWISETLKMRIAKIRETSPDTLLDLACFAGGSSGSAVGHVYSAILRNTKLFSQQTAGSYFTLDEGERVADAVHWMSLAADVSLSEYLNSLAQYVIELSADRVERTVKNAPLLSSIWKRIMAQKKVDWWDGNFVNGEMVLVDFLNSVTAAHLLDTKLLGEVYQPTQDRLLDAPEVANASSAMCQDSRWDEVLKNKAARVNAMTDARVQSFYRVGEYKLRYVTGAYQHASQSLKTVAEGPIPRGLCTMAMGALYKNRESIPRQNLPYSDLRPMAFCDQTTIETILKSPQYRIDITSEGNYASRFILVATKNVRTSLAVSLREPKMMREFYGQAGEMPFETMSFFDPLNKNHQAEIKLRPFQGEGIAIVGGFVDRRISAWLVAYFAEQRLNEIKSTYRRASAEIHTFGKPDTMREKKYDTVVIRQIFSTTKDEEKVHLNDWMGWQQQFCHQYLPRLRQRNVSFDTVILNWDLGPRPAAYTGQSHILRAKAINATRLQIGPASGKLLYDSLHGKPDPLRSGAIPCIEGL